MITSADDEKRLFGSPFESIKIVDFGLDDIIRASIDLLLIISCQISQISRMHS